MRPLYFDVTDIVQHAMTNTTVTGVQRTVLRILERVVRRPSSAPVYGLLHHPLTRQFRVADLAFMSGSYGLDDFSARFEVGSGKNRWLGGKLKNYHARPVRRALHKARFQAQWLTSPGLRRYVECRSPEIGPSCLQDTVPRPGGLIVTLGAGWGTDYEARHRFAADHACETVSFVHDVIPLTDLPFASDKGHRFRRWLDFVSVSDKRLLCNSHYTKRALEDRAHAQTLKAKVEVVAFPHEFLPPSSGDAHVRSEIQALLQEAYILCVGTLETRKNPIGLLQAWQALHRQGLTRGFKLVFAGGEGRGAGAVHAFLKETAGLAPAVAFAKRPNDLELELLYESCRFTVFPSFYEGWGLPIGESLWFGKPVVCANVSSMPEAGGAFARYFDPAEPEALAAALASAIETPPALPAGIRQHLVTWDQTAASVLEALSAAR